MVEGFGRSGVQLRLKLFGIDPVETTVSHREFDVTDSFVKKGLQTNLWVKKGG